MCISVYLEGNKDPFLYYYYTDLRTLKEKRSRPWSNGLVQNSPHLILAFSHLPEERQVRFVRPMRANPFLQEYCTVRVPFLVKLLSTRPCLIFSGSPQFLPVVWDIGHGSFFIRRWCDFACAYIKESKLTEKACRLNKAHYLFPYVLLFPLRYVRKYIWSLSFSSYCFSYFCFVIFLKAWWCEILKGV